MKILAMLCAMAALGLTLPGCNQNPPTAAVPPDTHDADVKTLTSNETQWNQEYVARDQDKITAHYADDAILMAPGVEPARGKAAIHAEIQQMLADKAFALSWVPARVEVAKSGDIGYTQGVYKLTATDPATHKLVNDHGTYVSTYRKQPDGSWKVVADIATSALPPAPPKHH